ncbi:MAG: hypothetical protein ACOYEJ_09195 [Mahellales bacterium]
MYDINSIIKNHLLPSKLCYESMKGGIKTLDILLSNNYPRDDSIITDINFLKRSRDEINNMIKDGYQLAKYSVLLPMGIWGFSKGLMAPDLDIKLLGIGRHRYFLFHSALGLVLLRHLYFKWIEKYEYENKWGNRVKKKIAGTLLGGYAVGVGVHLAIDVFQPKSIVFPFFGSLASGTLVDDNIWLLANSLWAFYIGCNLFSLVLADEISQAKKFIKKYFNKPIKLYK